jgi:hypothetical protein
MAPIGSAAVAARRACSGMPRERGIAVGGGSFPPDHAKPGPKTLKFGSENEKMAGTKRLFRLPATVDGIEASSALGGRGLPKIL